MSSDLDLSLMEEMARRGELFSGDRVLTLIVELRREQQRVSEMKDKIKTVAMRVDELWGAVTNLETNVGRVEADMSEEPPRVWFPMYAQPSAMEQALRRGASVLVYQPGATSLLYKRHGRLTSITPIKNEIRGLRADVLIVDDLA